MSIDYHLICPNKGLNSKIVLNYAVNPENVISED